MMKSQLVLCNLSQLEVVVTENPQTTVTFNVDPISVPTDIPESESESD